jgi:hypothetical protein
MATGWLKDWGVREKEREEAWETEKTPSEITSALSRYVQAQKRGRIAKPRSDDVLIDASFGSRWMYRFWGVSRRGREAFPTKMQLRATSAGERTRIHARVRTDQGWYAVVTQRGLDLMEDAVERRVAERKHILERQLGNAASRSLERSTRGHKPSVAGEGCPGAYDRRLARSVVRS